MADRRPIHLTISKGMKLSCTVEQANDDVIVVSLKYKTKEFRGILLDSSERHLPPGLCFNDESSTIKTEGENAGNSCAEGPDQPQPKEVRGVTLDSRYSYNYDPAKYNEQPLPTTSAISIRPARGKQVRNIRLRPRQTLCSKCKAAIHDSKSKSPNKIAKPEGEGLDQEAHPHNTRYRAAKTGKPTDIQVPGPNLRSGAKTKRTDPTTPKVLLENIRPKRDVKPTPKKKDADAAAAHRRMSESSARKSTASEEQWSDSSASKSDSNKRADVGNLARREDEGLRVIMERSISLDTSTALCQYNKQPVVRLDKTVVHNLSFRSETKEEKREKAPTISIVNIRSTPAIKISYGGAGDRDVVNIPPRLPGAELKSPDGHSTADESPAPVTPPPPPSPPQKKAKKASKRTRDKQRYRVVNEGDSAAEVNAQAIKIAGHHRKHKRKHKHRHASSEDENFNSEVSVPPPAKLPAIITKLSVVPPVNDMNGNEKKSDSEVLKDSSNETPTRQEEHGEGTVRSPFYLNDALVQSKPRREDGGSGFTFNSDPLSLRMDTIDSDVQGHHSERKSPRHHPERKSPRHVSNKGNIFTDQSRPEAAERLPSRSDVKPLEMWGSPVKIEAPTFDMGVSPTGIEAPPFQSDDSQDGLIIGPLQLGNSPLKDENLSSCDSLSGTPTSQREMEDRNDSDINKDGDESVPYGVGVFEDLTPDEDEDDNDEHAGSQPVYQVPLAKKPRMMYGHGHGGWAGDRMQSPSSHVSNYLPKKSAAVVPESYPSRPRMYQNGPTNSYFSPNPSSSSMYHGNQSSVFSNNPAPRIQNSPTPIIQKSPVPIFNYHSSRYQGSPNRRFGSSPSRRYSSIAESASSRTNSIIEGSIRHPNQSNLSRYHGQENDQFQVPADRHPSTSARYHHSQAEGDMSHSGPANRYPPPPNKFENRSTIRYQPPGEKSHGPRFTPQPERSSASRLPSAEDSGVSVTKPYRGGDSSPVLRYVSSAGDSGSGSVQPRFAIPSDGSASAPLYAGQGSGGSLNRYPPPRPPEGSNISNQYPSLGSTDSRYQPHSSEARYKLPNNASIPSSPSALSLQTNNRGSSNLVSGYRAEKEGKSSLVPGPRYETVDTSALFMTHSLGHNPVSSGDNSSVSGFLGKPTSVTSLSPQIPATRVPSSESVKSSIQFSAPSQGQSAPLAFLRQEPPKLVSGSGGGVGDQGVLFLGMGHSNSSSNLSRHTSSSNLSLGHHSVNLCDSDDDSDNAVPGVVAAPMMKIHSQTLPSCPTEDGREIRVGDVQWGKVQCFPWWPCRVMSIRLTQRDHREQERIVTQLCHVSWFGSSTVSDLPPSELRPFREEFSKRHVKKKRGPYQLAVQQAAMATELTTLSVLDASRGHAQQPSSLGLMHDLVS